MSLSKVYKTLGICHRSCGSAASLLGESLGLGDPAPRRYLASWETRVSGSRELGARGAPAVLGPRGQTQDSRSMRGRRGREDLREGHCRLRPAACNSGREAAAGLGSSAPRSARPWRAGTGAWRVRGGSRGSGCAVLLADSRLLFRRNQHSIVKQLSSN